MSRHSLLFLSAVAISCGGEPAFTMPAQAVASPSSSLAHYRTFSFGLTEPPPSGYPLSPRSLDVQARLRPLIATSLEQKGLSLQSGERRGELTVRFASDVRDGAVRRPNRNPDNHDTALEGTVVVDVFDAATGIELWHGSSVASIPGNGVDDAWLAQRVNELLRSFFGSGSGSRRARGACVGTKLRGVTF